MSSSLPPAIAVDKRWFYAWGSSRRRLPAVLSQLGQIDLFVHDSLHSERNVRFEIDLAWTFLRPGGAIVVDDIGVNRGLWNFIRSYSGHNALFCESEPLRSDLRRYNKKRNVRNSVQTESFYVIVET